MGWWARWMDGSRDENDDGNILRGLFFAAVISAPIWIAAVIIVLHLLRDT
jgi:hypothetical protein